MKEKEMNDYSGPLMRDLRPGDVKTFGRFTKDAMIRFMSEADKMFVGFAGCWNTLNRKRFGEGVANDMDREFWLQWGEPNMTWRWQKLFNIYGEDVASFMKYTQIEPVFLQTIATWEMKGDKLGIITCARCVTLDYMERHGEDRLQKHTCGLHVDVMRQAAHRFNPKMVVKPLLLPPRNITFGKSGRDFPQPLCCKFEISLP